MMYDVRIRGITAGRCSRCNRPAEVVDSQLFAFLTLAGLRLCVRSEGERLCWQCLPCSRRRHARWRPSPQRPQPLTNKLR